MARKKQKEPGTRVAFAGVTVALAFSLACGKSGPDKGGKKEGPLTPLKEYTVENPREWKNFTADHVPEVNQTLKNGQPALRVELPLVNTGPGHYIERVGIRNQHGKEIISQPLKRTARPKTGAVFLASKIPQKGVLKAYGKCNLHDTWTTTFRPEKLATND